MATASETQISTFWDNLTQAITFEADRWPLDITHQAREKLRRSRVLLSATVTPPTLTITNSLVKSDSVEHRQATFGPDQDGKLEGEVAFWSAPTTSTGEVAPPNDAHRAPLESVDFSIQLLRIKYALGDLAAQEAALSE